MLKKYLVILAVAAFIKDSKGRLLLVKKSPDEKIDAGLWVVPGGKINRGEFILDGLRREVMEEVNLKIKDPKWVNDNVFQSGGEHFHAQHFVCRTDDIAPLKLEEKLTDYAFVKKEDVNKFTIPKGLRETIDIIL